MGVGSGLYSLNVRCCRKFTFGISSPDEFLLPLTLLVGLASGRASGL